MALLKRSDVITKYPHYALMLSTEKHHNHDIELDDSGVLRWVTTNKKEDNLNDLWISWFKKGLTRNSEEPRSYYRSIGISLSSYYEVFYDESNNDIAKLYTPPKSTYTESDYKLDVEKLKKWTIAYYVNNSPLATDEEYDKLARVCKLFELENPELADVDSPNVKVGYVLGRKANSIQHHTRMWSMEDIFNDEELIEWINRYPEQDKYFTEPKFDGASLNLMYKNGVLTKAVTRGDGSVGEDVTTNALEVTGVLKEIPYNGLLEIRGEVVMKKHDFDTLNAEREEMGESLFANPRNAAAGSLRQKDPEITKSRKLDFMFWGVGVCKEKFDKQSDIHNFVKGLGFKADPACKVCKSKDELTAEYHRLIDTREEYEYAVDGMCIKLEDASMHDEIGYTAKYPKYFCAYKFPPVEKVITITGVHNQVGRTGVITPIASFRPVFIDGSTVERATLHNYSNINDVLGLKIGDECILIKSGDIIPKITKVFKERRNGDEKDIIEPTKCPSCDEALVKDKVIIKCVNPNCHSRLVTSLLRFGGRECLDIDNLGASLCLWLVKNNKIKSVYDIYNLTEQDFASVDGYKDKKIKNILTSINKARTFHLYRFIAGLNIDLIGVRMSRLFCKQFGMGIFDVTVDMLTALPGVGEEIANSFVSYMEQNKNELKEVIGKLNPILEEVLEVDTNSEYYGKKVVATGTFSIGKDAVKSLFESLGAHYSSGVTSKTDYLFVGDKPGASKVSKAENLKVPMLTADDLDKLIK